MPPSKEEQDAIAHADKDQWREREGWCTAEEAEVTLSGIEGAHIKIIRRDQEVKPAS